MEVIPTGGELGQPGDQPETQVLNETMFSTILETVGLDVVVGALHQRQRVKELGLQGSVVDHPQTGIQFNVHSDGIDFAMPSDEDPGMNWHGSLGYDDARRIVNAYIDGLTRTPDESAE